LFDISTAFFYFLSAIFAAAQITFSHTHNFSPKQF